MLDIEIDASMQEQMLDGKKVNGFMVRMRKNNEWYTSGFEVNSLLENQPDELLRTIETTLLEMFMHYFPEYYNMENELKRNLEVLDIKRKVILDALELYKKEQENGV